MSDISPEPDPLTAEQAIGRAALAPPHTVVPLRIRPDDFVALRSFVQKRQTWTAFAVWQVTLCCLLGGVIVLSRGMENLPLRSVLLVCGLVYTGGTLGFPVVRRWIDEFQLAHIRQEFASVGELPPAWIVISPQGYALISGDHVETWEWTRVREVVPLPDRLILINEQRDAHFVAQHMFDSEEQFAEFRELLTGYHGAAGLSPDPSSEK